MQLLTGAGDEDQVTRSASMDKAVSASHSARGGGSPVLDGPSHTIKEHQNLLQRQVKEHRMIIDRLITSSLVWFHASTGVWAQRG